MPAEYGFPKLTRADYPMLRRWLAEPHIAGWWGDPDTQIAPREDCDAVLVIRFQPENPSNFSKYLPGELANGQEGQTAPFTPSTKVLL